MDLHQHADFGSKITILILKATTVKADRSAPFQHNHHGEAPRDMEMDNTDTINWQQEIRRLRI